jgi:p-aminobenzoyl-glutamate transporter AbgT
VEKQLNFIAAGRYAKNVKLGSLLTNCLPGPYGVIIHLVMQVTVTVIDIYLVLSRQSNRLCKSSKNKMLGFTDTG